MLRPWLVALVVSAHISVRIMSMTVQTHAGKTALTSGLFSTLTYTRKGNTHKKNQTTYSDQSF